MRQNSQSRARNEANNLFKQTAKSVTTDEKAEQAFHANRERLKAERLAREAERRNHPGRTP